MICWEIEGFVCVTESWDYFVNCGQEVVRLCDKMLTFDSSFPWILHVFADTMLSIIGTSSAVKV